MASRRERLFVYGMLRSSTIREGLLGRSVVGRPGALCGWRLERIVVEGVEYAILAAGEPTDRVQGLVLDVDPEELRLFDEYESSAYRRVRVALEDGEGAWAYTRP